MVVYSFGCRIQNEFQPVKRRRALVETNLPRNSWPQTHQDDEARGGADDDLAPGSEQYIGLIDLPMPKKLITSGSVCRGRSGRQRDHRPVAVPAKESDRLYDVP